MKLFHLYPEGGPAPPMTSSICVFHLGISLVISSVSLGRRKWAGLQTHCNRPTWLITRPLAATSSTSPRVLSIRQPGRIATLRNPPPLKITRKPPKFAQTHDRCSRCFYNNTHPP